MKYLVVNGDDLGYSKPRNEGIIECYREGILTSTSLLINGEAVHHAVDLVKKYGIPTGLHLNLSEGLPLTNASSLLGEDGLMLGKHGIRDLHREGKIDIKEVEVEMQAQIDKFESLIGTKPFHVDGHQHVHLLSGICETFCKVLIKNDIYVTRLPTEDISSKIIPNKAFLQTVVEDSYGAKMVFDRYNIRYTDRFIGLNSYEVSVESVIDLLSDMINDCNYNNTSCEFMVHPGYLTEQEGGCGCGPDDFSQSFARENEMKFICDRKIRQFIDRADIKLVNFETLFPKKLCASIC